MALSGDPDWQTEWGESTIAHQFGRWVMWNYLANPHGTGKHFYGVPCNAALAYSGARAIPSGQSLIGSSYCLDRRQGTFFWIDLHATAMENGRKLVPPRHETRFGAARRDARADRGRAA